MGICRSLIDQRGADKKQQARQHDKGKLEVIRGESKVFLANRSTMKFKGAHCVLIVKRSVHYPTCFLCIDLIHFIMYTQACLGTLAVRSSSHK